MSYVLSYLFNWFWNGAAEFINHWYVRSFLNMTEYMLNLFSELDKSFALKVNLRNLFKPLYQDRNPIGYSMGFLFRTTRILMALIVYSLTFSITALLYAAWLLVPIFFLYKAITAYGK